MTPLISLTRALTDPALFGRTFAAPSFWTWRTLAMLIDGVPLTEPREIELAKQCSGRSVLPTKPVRRLPAGGQTCREGSSLVCRCLLACRALR